MNMKRSLAALGVVLAMGTGPVVGAEPEQDSVSKWGRWAVLSPAAGGEPYVAALAPDAAKNARPGEAAEFQPTVTSSDTIPPPVEPVLPPIAVPGPPGAPPPVGDPRDNVIPPIAEPGSPPPPSGDPRGG